MPKPTLHIAVMESSRIICEGIHAVLQQWETDCRIYKTETLEEFADLLETKSIDILIVNPMQFVNREKEVKKLRRNYPTLAVAGIDLGIVQKPSMQLLDTTFTLYDSQEHIINTLIKIHEKNQPSAQRKTQDDTLTEREIDVLTGLVNGQSNKEIADSLNISIHTVVSHRKNITLKTGIRSQSGLTIYAISKKIVAIEDIEL